MLRCSFGFFLGGLNLQDSDWKQPQKVMKAAVSIASF